MTTQTSSNRRRSLAGTMVVLCTLLFINGCQPRPQIDDTLSQPAREITDETGKRLTVPARIERIVSLAPNLTEIVYAVGAGDRLVGNTQYCDYPVEAKSVAKVGDTMQPNIEAIVALRPQLVLVSTASQLEAFTRQMQQQKIPVYITDPRDVEGVFRTILTIGELLGEGMRAQQVVKELRARTEAVESRVNARVPVKVFYQLSPKPLYTSGRDSYITDLIRRAGGKSVTGDVAGTWPKYSDEDALASQPEAIVMAAFDAMNGDKMEIADSLKSSPASKNGRVYGINGDFLSRPGPRIVDGLEQMAKSLHPDAFK